VLLALGFAGAAIPARAQAPTDVTESVGEQTPAIMHNTWKSVAPLPTAVVSAASALLTNEIYLVGGNNGTMAVTEVQIYNPATNAWSTGVAYPAATSGASATVVKNVLYVFGGTSDGVTPSNAVWAFNPKTKTWTSKAAMPTARWLTAAVVENNIVYVIGGIASPTNFVATVESYNPATNIWTKEAPMLGAKQGPAVGLLGTKLTGFTIVAADGAISPSQITGDTEGYNAVTNTRTELAADPTARVFSCFGSIGPKLYDAGGYLNNGGAAATVNESFQLSKNKWTKTLAPMPQGTMLGASAVYKGQLYCIGGWATWLGAPINNVQVYQP
jgi:N-acetylneuraminic acid mutarotase